MGTKLMAPYSVLKVKNVANVSTNRILKLNHIDKFIGDEGARSTVTMKKFQNVEIHAIQENGLWYLAYKTPEGYGAGSLPEQLKQRWTNFNQLRKYLDSFFASKNIKIEEVVA